MDRSMGQGVWAGRACLQEQIGTPCAPPVQAPGLPFRRSQTVQELALSRLCYSSLFPHVSKKHLPNSMVVFCSVERKKGLTLHSVQA
ncbi:hypothetical protein TREES_T100015792 [Tupaia chinensis]|uniref:Uncharacterized protein n=1 Tax=Tupaia chinensis TaxID=246437 RepID=L9LAS7_TUPCH|nr:hypothetical protein TREES_T100015792 [Tupaia chinensis]